MLYKILKKDVERKKGITIALFLFILLSSILIASGTYMISVIMGSIDNLFEASKIPDYVQMHSGNLDEEDIERFSLSNSFVEDWQVVKMISVDPGNLYLGNNPTAEINSVMNISFVTQNETFDYLLNMENQPVSVKKGQIGVPVYYLQKYGLKKGDTVKLKLDGGIAEFIISDFVRDAQMNPTIVSSKRFVISKKDYRSLSDFPQNFEYSIEFLLKDTAKLSEFSNEYQAAGLPAKGPTLDAGTFKLLNALTDGIVAAVIILISLLLVAISVLCLRFTFLSSIEEDYKEIGVMKAIGIRHKDIKTIYLMKYVTMGAAASLAGYLLSFWVGRLFTSNMVLYLGTSLAGPSVYLMPFITTSIMYLFLILSCMAVLKQLNKISAVEALRSGRTGDMGKQLRIFHLDKRKYMNPDVFMGLKDIICRFPVYALLLFIFTLSAFIMIIPVNLYNTMDSDEFITYMGIGKSQIRMDLQQSEGMEERYAAMIESIKKDPQVSLYSPTITCKYKVKNGEGLWENLNVETGDFNIFPLEYMTGKTPSRKTEIALSYLASDNLKKGVGDQITLMVDGVETLLTVSGIYQDITNGGQTAKAMIPVDSDTVLWYVISLNLKDGVDSAAKIKELTALYPATKITHIDQYLNQTLGSTIKQLKMAKILSVVLAGVVAALITSLFLKMQIAKESSQIAIMKSLGFSVGNIRVQYLVRIGSLLLAGVVIGTFAANTLGQGLVSGLAASYGACKIQFVIRPFEAFFLSPAILFTVVLVTTVLSIIPMNKASITEMIVE